MNKLEKLQELALATVYRDRSLTYDDMLRMNGRLSIRMNLVRLLAIEVFKCVNGTNHVYLNELFITHESNFDLRNKSRILLPKFNTYKYGYNSHYSDVEMGTVASQITSLTIVYFTVYSGADQRKHQSSASLAFVRGIHRSPVNSPHKGPVTRKMFPFDDAIMI